MGAIIVKNLGKAYKQYHSKWGRLAEWFLPGSKQRHNQHWVLKDVNFTIQPGEAVGIIGVNGAGKSTLLKMITGTTQPTTGAIEINGRVAALLELGMGFHPDFTGRENVFMSGQLMGLSVEEIQTLIPEIEAFAEIGDYIDQPVRVYSSGMQVRLAFSVATASRPDILIVDEALSVGDAYFQHKSFERLRKFLNMGSTLLIVSHDRSAIQSLCRRAILLETGCVIKDSNPEEVFDYYNALIAEQGNKTVQVSKDSHGRVQTTSGTGQAKIEDIVLYNSKGKRAECIKVGEKVKIQIGVRVIQNINSLVLGYAIKNSFGQLMYGTNTWHEGNVITNAKAGREYQFHISFLANLGTGSYSVGIALHDGDSHLYKNYEWRDLAYVFRVVNLDKVDFLGCNWLEQEIRIKAI